MNETYRRVFGVRRTTPEVVSCTWREEFGCDAAGNRIQKRSGWGAVDYTYSGENRLIRAGGSINTMGTAMSPRRVPPGAAGAASTTA